MIYCKRNHSSNAWKKNLEWVFRFSTLERSTSYTEYNLAEWRQRKKDTMYCTLQEWLPCTDNKIYEYGVSQKASLRTWDEIPNQMINSNLPYNHTTLSIPVHRKTLTIQMYYWIVPSITDISLYAAYRFLCSAMHTMLTEDQTPDRVRYRTLDY